MLRGSRAASGSPRLANFRNGNETELTHQKSEQRRYARAHCRHAELRAAVALLPLPREGKGREGKGREYRGREGMGRICTAPQGCQSVSQSASQKLTPSATDSARMCCTAGYCTSVKFLAPFSTGDTTRPWALPQLFTRHNNSSNSSSNSSSNNNNKEGPWPWSLGHHKVELSQRQSRNGPGSGSYFTPTCLPQYRPHFVRGTVQ